MTGKAAGTGVLYLHGDRDRVDGWVRRGSGPCYVVPFAGWTAVVPAGSGQVPPPYDEPLSMLASRAVPSPMRSAIGLFSIDGRAVVTVQPTGWRAMARWLVWEPGRGAAGLQSLPTAAPADIVRAAGVQAQAARELRELFAERSGTVSDLLGEVVRLLALPGERLVHGRGVRSAEGSVLVEPGPKSVREYERVVTERREVHDAIAGPSS